jgi:hypothetical protein
MNRNTRIFAVVVFSFVLLFTALPAAHARTLGNPPSSHPVLSGIWLNATLGWMGNLLGVTHSAQPAQRSEKIPLTSPPPGGIASPMTCSTIDPNGAASCGGF